MDIADQFQEIGVFFADDGFVSVLEEMAGAFVSFIEGNGIPCHQSAHDFAEGGRGSSQEEVKMVRDQSPGIALGLGLFEDGGQAIKEGVAILVVPEDLSSFDSPAHDVLEEAGGI